MTTTPPPLRNEQNTSVLIHLSSFLKWFVPFAGLIAPLLIWSHHRDKQFVDAHGREAINFQLSMMLYKFILLICCIPFFVMLLGDLAMLSEAAEEYQSFDSIFSISFSVTGFVILLILLSFVSLFEFIVVILAAVRASNGQLYRYPLRIGFIKKEPVNPNDI